MGQSKTLNFSILLNGKLAICLLRHAFVASQRTSKFPSLTNQKVPSGLNEKNFQDDIWHSVNTRFPKTRRTKYYALKVKVFGLPRYEHNTKRLRHSWNVKLRVNNSCLLILRPIWNKRSAGLLAVRKQFLRQTCKTNFLKRFYYKVTSFQEIRRWLKAWFSFASVSKRVESSYDTAWK